MYNHYPSWTIAPVCQVFFCSFIVLDVKSPYLIGKTNIYSINQLPESGNLIEAILPIKYVKHL